MNILYCRKSTESEDRQVLSIDSQIKELSDLAEREGLKIDQIITESMSAKMPGRPEFAHLLQLIEKDKDITLFCWKLDRLARNFADGGAIIQYLQNGWIKEIKTPARLYLPTDNVLLMSVEFGMATQFSNDLSYNVKRGIKAKLEKGGWIGRAPIGYLNDKANHTVYPDPANSAHVIKVFEMFASGAYNLKQITDTLHTQGFRTMYGGKIHHTVIYRILNNPFYAGMIRYKGKLFPGSHVPLVSQTLFDQCQQVFSPNRSRTQRHLFPLRGFMSCAECGCALTASTKKGYKYYYCTNGKKICSQHKAYSRAEVADHLIAGVLHDLQVDRDLIDLLYDSAKEYTADQQNQHEAAKQNVAEQLKSLAQKKIRLEEVYLEGSMDKERYSARILEMANEEVSLENALKQLETSGGSATLEQIKNAFLTAFSAEKDYLEADENKKAELAKILLWNVSISDGKVQQYQLKQPFQLIAEAPKTNDILIWQGV